MTDCISVWVTVYGNLLNWHKVFRSTMNPTSVPSSKMCKWCKPLFSQEFDQELLFPFWSSGGKIIPILCQPEMANMCLIKMNIRIKGHLNRCIPLLFCVHTSKDFSLLHFILVSTSDAVKKWCKMKESRNTSILLCFNYCCNHFWFIIFGVVILNQGI